MPWIALGSLSTGIVVGFLCWYFITRLKAFTIVALTGIIGLMFSGVVVTFLVNSLKVDAAGFGQYAVGLLIGLIVYAVFTKLNSGKFPTLG